MVSGTAAKDYQRRDHTTAHYRSPVEIKSRLRFLIYSHFLLAFLVFAHIFTYHVPLASTLNVPRPHLWQYLWFNSVFASICGILAINKNRVFLMKIFFHGTIIFGLGTIIITIIINLSELFTFKRLKNNHQLDELEPQTFLGFPLLVLWYIFLIITVQIHAFSLYMANLLICNWQQYKSTKNF